MQVMKPLIDSCVCSSLICLPLVMAFQKRPCLRNIITGGIKESVSLLGHWFHSLLTVARSPSPFISLFYLSALITQYIKSTSQPHASCFMFPASIRLAGSVCSLSVKHTSQDSLFLSPPQLPFCFSAHVDLPPLETFCLKPCSPPMTPSIWSSVGLSWVILKPMCLNGCVSVCVCRRNVVPSALARLF